MKTLEIVVLYHSPKGSTALLAEHVARGVASVPGAMPLLRTVAPIAVQDMPQSSSASTATAPYLTKTELKNCSGLLMGSPTHFGQMSAALKHFWDQTSDLWLSGSLVNKPAGVFTTTSSWHGGQEATLLSMMLPLLHHGMLLVGLPYTELNLVKTQTGGTPYGSSHISGRHHENPLSVHEIELAFAHGKRVASLATQLSRVND